jgi:hypothetical protein
MKRLWKLANADIGRALLCWAADSKVGACVLIGCWLGVHALWVYQVSTGRTTTTLSTPSYVSLPLCYPPFWVSSVGLVVLDVLIARSFWRESKKKPNQRS